MVFLVSCTKRKKGEGPHQAKDLYDSVWFNMAKKYIGEQQWYILSAKHHLLGPTELINPYNVSLHDFTRQERKEWSKEVCLSLIKICSPCELTVFAGKRYTQYLDDILVRARFNPIYPLSGLGIGNQLKWFKENTIL